jgi:hypothetical protein
MLKGIVNSVAFIISKNKLYKMLKKIGYELPNNGKAGWLYAAALQLTHNKCMVCIPVYKQHIEGQTKVLTLKGKAFDNFKPSELIVPNLIVKAYDDGFYETEKCWPSDDVEVELKEINLVLPNLQPITTYFDANNKECVKAFQNWADFFTNQTIWVDGIELKPFEPTKNANRIRWSDEIIKFKNGYEGGFKEHLTASLADIGFVAAKCIDDGRPILRPICSYMPILKLPLYKGAELEIYQCNPKDYGLECNRDHIANVLVYNPARHWADECFGYPEKGFGFPDKVSEND